MSEYLRRFRLVAVAGVTAAGLGLAQARAGAPVSVSVSADLVSKYVWRGILVTDDPVFQPSVTASWKGLSLNVWGSVDLTDVNENPGDNYRLQEVDYTGSYSFSPVKGLDLTGGAILYTFAGFPDTSEVFATAALSCVPLTPTLSVYYDFGRIDGFYANLGISHTFTLTEKLSLGLSASLGCADSDYNAFYFGVDENAFNDGVLGANLDYKVNENFALSLYAKYSKLLDSDIEDSVDDSDLAIVGVRGTLSF